MTKRRFIKWRWSATALVTSLAVFIAMLLAVNPTLHSHLHFGGHLGGDTPLNAHQCAASMFAKGLVDASGPLPVNTGFRFEIRQVPQLADPILLPATKYLLLPERAPPLA